jgi:choline dehydrogenase-like flavoprotein
MENPDARNALNTCATQEREWDVIIIGTGMGGATVGYSLAKSGHRVLFLERGKRLPKSCLLQDIMVEGAQQRLDLGLWPTELSQKVDGSMQRFLPLTGCGVGGSTLFYAAALERFESMDFSGSDFGQQGCPAWPITSDEMSPYYDAAETLYRARRGVAASETAGMSTWDQQLM